MTTGTTLVSERVEGVAPRSEPTIRPEQQTIENGSAKGITAESLFEYVKRLESSIRQLEESNAEIIESYKKLEATYREVEITNMELQNINMALQDTNEELQKTNRVLGEINGDLVDKNKDLKHKIQEHESTIVKLQTLVSEEISADESSDELEAILDELGSRLDATISTMERNHHLYKKVGDNLHSAKMSLEK